MKRETFYELWDYLTLPEKEEHFSLKPISGAPMGLMQMTGNVLRTCQSRSRLLNQPHLNECPAKSLPAVPILGFDLSQLIQIILEAAHAN